MFARIGSAAGVLSDEFGEARHIAQSQIESHACHRMQALRGIADDDATRRAGALRLCQRERIRHAASYFEESAQAKPETALYFGEEFLIRPGQSGLRGVLG